MSSSRYLRCGRRVWFDNDHNPFVAYKALKSVETHFQRCLPCLLGGSFKSQMLKEIQKFMLSALVRVVSIVSIWVSLSLAFLWSHRHEAISDKDVFFLITVAMAILFTTMMTLMDGPREFS